MGIICGLFKALSNASDNESDRHRERLSRECDMIGLDKEEKEQVMLGNQDPYDFEWDGTEETDYYKDNEK